MLLHNHLKENLESLNKKKIISNRSTNRSSKGLPKFKNVVKQPKKEAKRATELADKARAEAVMAQKEKNEIRQIAMGRLTQIEKAERHIETLDWQKYDLTEELKKIQVLEFGICSNHLLTNVALYFLCLWHFKRDEVVKTYSTSPSPSSSWLYDLD